jgi:hypothetical protein
MKDIILFTKQTKETKIKVYISELILYSYQQHT